MRYTVEIDIVDSAPAKVGNEHPLEAILDAAYSFFDKEYPRRGATGSVAAIRVKPTGGEDE